MTILKIILTIGVFLMTAAIAYGFIAGEHFVELNTLLRYPWFHVSMIDLYVGFLLFSGWVIYREEKLGVALTWVFFMLTLGNFTACLYALIAATKARGDWHQFWLGARASS